MMTRSCWPWGFRGIRREVLALCCTSIAWGGLPGFTWGQDAPPYVAIGKYEEQPGAHSRRSGGATAGNVVQDFRNAVMDAATAEPAEISRDLRAVTPWEPGLVTRGEGDQAQVLVVTWTSYTGYDALVGQPTVATRDVWITLAPDARTFCRRHRMPADRMTLRMEQLLGLPPGNGKTRFVEFWVSPDDLFRPSPDPTVTDREAELDFPRSTLFAAVEPAHIDWFNNLRATSYGPDGYPWTRLGYTFDWKRGSGEIGLSEFVIRAGATVEVNAVILNRDFFTGR